MQFIIGQIYLHAQKVGVIGRTCQLSIPKPASQLLLQAESKAARNTLCGRGVLKGWCADTLKIPTVLGEISEGCF